ncbi:serine/threonine-protein kinase [Candidatus Uabimicrobium amorphum]|uniref:Protein kinase domain-containing protein n=1 Tax=Uabimicrobium amorphum TaxID=2596890 RepID=A0A5S9F594_UABAM|nr:serine/threonine-protein kinase [Candidatus Uabimicrobium amorphum]BBM85923.1 hypothetical protein UABAM_04309 [Candidatus Uabimicrobium amorphum]
MKTRKFGRYVLEKELGRGGMGVVYQAYDTYLKRFVALKLILQGDVKRFLKESEMMAQLKHENIIQFYEFSNEPQPFFTMEYVEGTTLSQGIKERKIEPGLLVEIMIQVCKGLVAAHKKNIIHRDLKPSNILVTSSGRAKIMDFGLAKRLEQDAQQLSKTGQIVGTVLYMPIEQIEGHVNEKSDIYSLGATMYEALTYRTVFQGATDINIIFQIQNKMPIPLRELNPDISPYLEAICLKCLSRNPNRRYQSAQQLLQELENFKNHRPIIARRYTHIHALRNLMFTHRKLFAVMGLIIAMLVIFSGYMISKERALQQTNNELKLLNSAMIEFVKNIQKSSHSDMLVNPEIIKPLAVVFSQSIHLKTAEEYIFLRGVILGQSVDKKNMRQAIIDYTQTIRQYPKMGANYNNRGAVYVGLEKHDSALKDFDKAIALTPHEAEYYYNRGFVYHELHNYEKALQDYKQAIELNPQYSKAYYSRGNLYKFRREYEKAVLEYNKVVALTPNDRKAYYQRGNTYRSLRQYTKAKLDYDKTIRLDTKNPEGYVGRGEVYIQLGKYDKALRDIDTAISLDAKYYDAYIVKAFLYKRLRKYEQAEMNYNKAIAMNPDSGKAYINRGNMYSDWKKYTKAQQDYDKAKMLSPDDPVIYYNHGNLYKRWKKYAEAKKNYDKAIALDATYSEAYANRANIYYAWKDYKKALVDYEKAIILSPKNIQIYSNRGAMYCSLEQYSKAMQDFDKILSIDPKNANAYGNKGIVCYNKKNYRQAIRFWQYALQLAPQEMKFLRTNIKFAKRKMNKK